MNRETVFTQRDRDDFRCLELDFNFLPMTSQPG